MGRIVGENKHKGTLYPVDSKAIYRIIYEVVSVLPTENIKTSVIYCVPIIGKDNEYNMYLYIDGWVNVGSGSIDLSDYYTKEEVDSIVADISTLSFKIVQQKPIEDIETNIIYLIPKSESSAGNVYEEWIYIDNKWELLGTTDIDLSNYMTLAPINPTAEQIAAMPSGQFYGDTVNHKGVVKGGQSFYDTVYVDSKLSEKLPYPPTISFVSESDAFPKGTMFYYMGGTYIKTKPSGSSGCDSFVFSDSLTHGLSLKEDKFRYIQRPPNRAPVTEPNKSVWVWGGSVFILWDNGTSGGADYPIWIRIGHRIVYDSSVPTTQETNCPYVPAYYAGDKWVSFANIDEGEPESALEQKVYICTRVSCEKNDDGTWNYSYTWKPFPIGADSIASYGITDAYTKTEIDSMIGDIETALSEV